MPLSSASTTAHLRDNTQRSGHQTTCPRAAAHEQNPIGRALHLPPPERASVELFILHYGHRREKATVDFPKTKNIATDSVTATNKEDLE